MKPTETKSVAGLPIAHQRFCDIQLLASGHPLIKMSYLQTSRGQFNGELTAVGLPEGGLFWRSKTNLGGVGQGEIASGYRMVAVAGNHSVEHWHGQELPGDRLATGTGEIGLQHRTGDHHEALCWMVTQSRLDQIGEDLGLDPGFLKSAGPWLAIHPDRLLHYRNSIEDFLSGIDGRDDLPEGEALCFEEFLVATVLRGLPQPSKSRLPRTSPTVVARQVRDLLHCEINQPLQVAQLCRSLSLNERTLHRHFYSTYGISPHAYHQNLRLHAVRLKLLEAGESCPGVIHRAATNFGFWHMGRFCCQYRLLFGETPTETLRYAREIPPSRFWPGLTPQTFP